MVGCILPWGQNNWPNPQGLSLLTSAFHFNQFSTETKSLGRSPASSIGGGAFCFKSC